MRSFELHPNKLQFNSILEILEANEQGLIIYHENTTNWFLVTNIRVIFSQNNSVQSIFYIDFEEVRPAFKEDLKKGVIAADEFTKLLIKDKNKKEYIVSIEKGNPYKGIYQLLHFAQN